MTNGSTGHAAATGIGRRRGSRGEIGSPPDTPAPGSAAADPAASGLGLRRTGSPPSGDARTSLLHRDAAASSWVAATSVIRPPDAGPRPADGTGGCACGSTDTGPA